MGRKIQRSPTVEDSLRFRLEQVEKGISWCTKFLLTYPVSPTAGIHEYMKYWIARRKEVLQQLEAHGKKKASVRPDRKKVRDG